MMLWGEVGLICSSTSITVVDHSQQVKNKRQNCSGVWMLYLHKNILCHTQYRKYQISQIAFIQDGEINTLITELKFAVRSSLDISHTFIHCTKKADHSNHLYTSTYM